MGRLSGRCHCGNLSVVLQTTSGAGELGARTCSCSFCQARRLRWTADPDGAVEVVVRDEGELSRYRFGTETAEFLICRRCGMVAAAVSLDAAPRAVVNVDGLDAAGEFVDAGRRDFAGEDVATRLARRARGWMPARVIVLGS